MQVTTSNLSPVGFVQLAHSLFLGRTLADTYGFGTVTADYLRVPQQNWTLDQLLLLSSARSSTTLA
ncbi:hypothetical protein [Leptolyngbya iicbica]|uniref:Uncharacterized protein n=2 Tax=Cyanophyceae TaxID=3028117 RepID=A0A4Q7E480_9CYAN|nr:hypothetical protein [Leptolyngbya sp. LK]RZM76504.1 hypothetical protein DYY88_17700 [Leptolyngbya sp. LK]